MTIDISIIICTTGSRPTELKKCLRSIRDQTKEVLEVIIVCGGLTRSDVEEFKTQLDEFSMSIEFRVVSCVLGLTIQRNKGKSLAYGDLVSFLDDDVVLEPNYFEAIEKVFKDDSAQEIGGVDGSVVTYEAAWKGNLIGRCIKGIVWWVGYGNTTTRVPAFIGPSIVRTWKHNKWTDRISGCNMTFRRDVINDRVFDENMSGYALGEDVDISLQVRRTHKLLHLSDARLTHLKSEIERHSIFRKIQARLLSWEYLSRKHNLKRGVINRSRMLVSLTLETILLSILYRVSLKQLMKLIWIGTFDESRVRAK